MRATGLIPQLLRHEAMRTISDSVTRSPHAGRRRRWRPSALLIGTAIAALAGATVLSYSPAASWISAYNQSLIVGSYLEDVETAEPSAAEQLATAAEYNDALSAGAILQANTNVPTGNGTNTGEKYHYEEMLSTPNGAMSRVQIPSIDVDLPIYHGTSDVTLGKGAGHLEGTSLPVGGEDTHSVITAHRGLADATMFTNLDQVEVGDTFIITTFDKIMTYVVVDTKVVDPTDTASLRQEAGRDLVTLVTCTPLGINTHRILVTGERVLPTPDKDIAAATEPVEEAGFPWWLLTYVGILFLIGVYIWRGGLVPVHATEVTRRRRLASRARRSAGSRT